jgi:hypothetical protein
MDLNIEDLPLMAWCCCPYGGGAGGFQGGTGRWVIGDV